MKIDRTDIRTDSRRCGALRDGSVCFDRDCAGERVSVAPFLTPYIRVWVFDEHGSRGRSNLRIDLVKRLKSGDISPSALSTIIRIAGSACSLRTRISGDK